MRRRTPFSRAVYLGKAPLYTENEGAQLFAALGRSSPRRRLDGKAPLYHQYPTGSLQVLPTEIETPEQPTLPLSAQPTGLFKHVRDKHLLRLGVPEALLLLVRQIETDTDLEAHETDFPQEAAEALYMLAMGYDVEQAFNELNKEIETDAAVDPNDFETALENEDSQRRFHVVTDALDLAEILKAPLEKWRVFLHPS